VGTGTLTPAGTICRECGLPVIHAGGMLLDPEPVVGGLYELRRGVRRRRRLTHISAEIRARQGLHGGGYDPHQCPLPLHWTDR
jgi:hypothetical protein